MNVAATAAFSAASARDPVTKIRLDSWKSIAEYLKRSPRTVQRWHAEYGLPVHHFGGGKGPVFSYSDELDAWLYGFSEDHVADAGAPDEGLGARKSRSLQLAAQADEMWELRSDRNLSVIAALYRGAIDLDPGNAPAFIGLANTLILASLVGILRSSAAYPRANEAITRAAHLGSDSAEMRCAEAWQLTVQERKRKAARAKFEEVLRRQPGSAFALAGRALLHVAEGNLGEASRCFEDAWKQNTFASASNGFLCWVQYLEGDYNRALETIELARAGGDNSSITAAVEALAMIQTGPIGLIVKRIEFTAAANPKNLVLCGALGYACARADQQQRAREIVQDLRRFQGEPAYPLALVQMGLDNRHEAVSCLERSYVEGSLWSLGFRFDPVFQPLRGDHRFEALLRRLEPSE
jgi:tetratricopeptide (TPR) repeat protein